MRRSAVALLALTLHAALSIAVPCFAQSATNDAAAQKLFEEGRRLMAAGSYSEACEKFDASDKLSPAGGTVLNLAECYEKAGKTASSWAKYNEAADRASAAHRADAERFARDHARALDGALSYLKVRVDDKVKATPGVSIRVDGGVIEPALWGAALPMDPGTHEVQVTAPGKKAWSTHENVMANGNSIEVVVGPLNDATDGPSQPAPPLLLDDADRHSSTGSTQRTIGIAVAAAGVVGLGVGTFFGVRALSEHDSINCPGQVCNTQADKDTNDKSQTAALVSTVAFVGGGVLVAGGVVLFLIAPHSEKTTGFRIVPSLGTNSGRVTLEGRF
jgi:hypothetical protein